MSEQLYGTTTGRPSQPNNPSGKLYNAAGQMIQPTAQQAQSTAVQVEEYIRQQPLSAVLMALGIGYILGKIW